jgi:elongation factor 1-alpha
MAKLQAEADSKGKSSFAFAYYMDTCKEERERGVTIQCNTKEFYTPNYHYTIVDAPGHKDYIKNMITGSGSADAALILVPAEKGGFEAAIAKADPKLGVDEGQTRQHARLLFLLGIEQIIVGVNKMDSCDWSESRFTEIKDEFVKMITQIGFKPKKVPVIPYSGFHGENLVTKSEKAPWYKGWKANMNPTTVIEGWTILDALDKLIKPPKRQPDAPLRLPISNIYNIKGVGQIICGRVEQGTVRPGDIVGFAPSGIRGKKMFQIEQHHKQLASAGPGENVGMSIKGIGKDEKIAVGDVIYIEKQGILNAVKSFTAMVFVQEHPGVLKKGYCPVIFSRTARVACKMTAINWKQSKKTGNEKVENPDELSQFEQAEVVFEPTSLLYLDTFEQCQGLARIAVMDSNRLKMLGKVVGVEYKQ